MALVGIGAVGLLVLLAGAAVYFVIVFNGLVRLRNNIDKAWSNIDVVLKQRFDELPRLVEVCKGYIAHERQTLESVTRARSRVEGARGDREMFGAQSELTGALRGLFALAENYPDLKANDMFQRLQTRITQLEDIISDRREFFNESVTIYNTSIEQFPDVFVARLGGFAARTLWEIDPAERARPASPLG